MGRNSLIELMHSYYWGRLDKLNWTTYDDNQLIDRLLGQDWTEERNVNRRNFRDEWIK